MISLIQSLKFERIHPSVEAISEFMAIQGHTPCAVMARRAAALIRAGF